MKAQNFILFLVLLFVLPVLGISQTCDCKEYVYLNEPGTGGIHKFRIEPDGSFTEIFSSGTNPWYAGNQLPSPHGLGVDLNGFLYIGERETNFGDIRRLRCDGTILPESEFAIRRGTYSIHMIGNTLYTNSGFATHPNYDIIAYDVCTQDELNGVQFCEPINDLSDWGFYIDPRTKTMYATAGFYPFGNAPNYLWVFDASDFDTNPGTCVSAVTLNPALPPNTADIRGVVTDVDGNIYIAVRNYNGGSYILKYDSNYNLVAQSPIDNAEDGIGYRLIIGLIYSETTNTIYASSESDVESCVTAFSTDLQTISEIVGPAPSGSNGKGIALSKECCPTITPQILSENICYNGGTDLFFLNEILNCGDGVVCEGMWSNTITNPNIQFNECDFSIEVPVVLLSCCRKHHLEPEHNNANPLV